MLRSGPLLPLLGQSNQTCLHQPKQEKVLKGFLVFEKSLPCGRSGVPLLQAVLAAGGLGSAQRLAQLGQPLPLASWC